MEEIQALLIEHDVAGVVILHTPGGGNSLVEISPSYSCAKFEGNGVEVVIKAERADFPSDEAMDKKLADTLSIFSAMNHFLPTITYNFLEIEKKLARLINSYANIRKDNG